MKFKVLFLAFIVFSIVITSAYAQQVLNADDLIVNMASTLDLSFRQEDAIKPLIKEYVAKVQQAYDEAQGNDQSIQSVISLLNMALQQRLITILTTGQIHKWDMAKKSLLPQRGQ